MRPANPFFIATLSLALAAGSPSMVVAQAESTAAPASLRTDLLPGVALIVEEIEPGIARVLGDGVEPLPAGDESPITLRTGLDGSAWVLAPDHFRRLGDTERHAWPKGRRPNAFEIGPDGTAWGNWESADHTRTVTRSFDGTSWVRRAGMEQGSFRPGDGSGGRFTSRLTTVVGPDGTAWTAWADPQQRFGRQTIVARLGPDGWEPVGSPIEVARCCGADLTVTDAGEVWAVGNGPRVYRLVAGDWQEQQLSAPARYSLRIAPDGTVWQVDVQPRQADGECLLTPGGDPMVSVVAARFDGNEWHAWEWGLDHWLDGAGAVSGAPDGSIWIGNFVDHDWDPAAPGGVVRFDGTTWQHFLPDLHVRAIEVATDGTVWLSESLETGGPGWYVVDPEQATPSAVVDPTSTTLRPRAPETMSEPDTAPAPVVRADILPGVELTTEEVEPGVPRVVSDGRLHLEWDGDLPSGLLAGPDGSVWVSEGDRLHRLGDSTTSVTLPDGLDLEVAPDGTIWQIMKGNPYTIRSFDGKGWTTRMGSQKRNPKAIEIAADGTVWAMWLERRSTDEKYEKEDALTARNVST